MTDVGSDEGAFFDLAQPLNGALQTIAVVANATVNEIGARSVALGLTEARRLFDYGLKPILDGAHGFSEVLGDGGKPIELRLNR